MARQNAVNVVVEFRLGYSTRLDRFLQIIAIENPAGFFMIESGSG